MAAKRGEEEKEGKGRKKGEKAGGTGGKKHFFVEIFVYIRKKQ